VRCCLATPGGRSGGFPFLSTRIVRTHAVALVQIKLFEAIAFVQAKLVVQTGFQGGNVDNVGVEQALDPFLDGVLKVLGVLVVDGDLAALGEDTNIRVLTQQFQSLKFKLRDRRSWRSPSACSLWQHVRWLRLVPAVGRKS
jgi:hypothetical protein